VLTLVARINGLMPGLLRHSAVVGAAVQLLSVKLDLTIFVVCKVVGVSHLGKWPLKQTAVTYVVQGGGCSV
jgi:hypothetical protein